MTNTAASEDAPAFYTALLEERIGKDQSVTIKTLSGDAATGYVEELSDGVVTLKKEKKTSVSGRVERWYIRIDHISVIHTVN